MANLSPLCCRNRDAVHVPPDVSRLARPPLAGNGKYMRYGYICQNTPTTAQKDNSRLQLLTTGPLATSFRYTYWSSHVRLNG